MKTSRFIFGVFTCVALIASWSAQCAGVFPEKEGYLIDTRGVVTRNSYRECWHTGFWTPSMAIEECDPGLVMKPKVAELPPPVAVVSSEANSPVVEPPPPLALVEQVPPGVERPVAAVVTRSPFEDLPSTSAGPAVAAYFDAETLFDFDKTVVKPAGRKILDEKIVSGMRMHPEVTLLLITGYADRIGTDAYNQGLSERRANAVKAYLVKQGIAAERMRTSGKGESEPNPQANTPIVCKGIRGERLIACLQPDRRVIVESQR